MATTNYPRTPDGRYFVARERLWRCSDPRLPEERRQALVNELMAARRAVRDASGEAHRREARTQVDRAKRALGERGPVWWDDAAPDESRRHPARSRYADWWAALDADSRAAGS